MYVHNSKPKSKYSNKRMICTPPLTQNVSRIEEVHNYLEYNMYVFVYHFCLEFLS